MVLLGPSGCGKTTLLNLLAGLIDVSSGRISIGERDVTDLDPKDRGLAMVFQSYALYPTKTVRGNLKFGLRAGKARQGRAASGASPGRRSCCRSSRCSTASRRSSPVASGSASPSAGRWSSRSACSCSTSRCAISTPSSAPRRGIEIKRLHDETKSTIVYVTHDQIEAMTMATKIAIMNAGVIQQFGTPDEIYERPANLFVAGFIGSPAMNLFPATIDHGGASSPTTSAPAHRARSQPVPLRQCRRARATSIVLGLRPEHFWPAERRRSANAPATFTLPVQYTEKTGGDATAYFKTGDRADGASRVDPSGSAELKQGRRRPDRLSAGQGARFRRGIGTAAVRH